MADTKQDLWAAKNQKSSDMNFSDTIFQELAWSDKTVGVKQKNSQNDEEKTPGKLLDFLISVFTVVNVLWVVFLIGTYFFIKIQNDESYNGNASTDFFCFLLLWDLQVKNTSLPNGIPNDHCLSISALKQQYVSAISVEKTNQVSLLDTVFVDLFTIENFNATREIVFLQDSKYSRLRALDIYNDFDILKNSFSRKSDTNMLLKCADIRITDSYSFTTKCEVYSNWMTPDDLGVSNGIIGALWSTQERDLAGSSISQAASFLNYIEKNPQYNFQILDPQTMFTTQESDEPGFLYKTSFDLKLKYNNFKDLLSL